MRSAACSALDGIKRKQASAHPPADGDDRRRRCTLSVFAHKNYSQKLRNSFKILPQTEGRVGFCLSEEKGRGERSLWWWTRNTALHIERRGEKFVQQCHEAGAKGTCDNILYVCEEGSRKNGKSFHCKAAILSCPHATERIARKTLTRKRTPSLSFSSAGHRHTPDGQIRRSPMTTSSCKTPRRPRAPACCPSRRGSFPRALLVQSASWACLPGHLLLPPDPLSPPLLLHAVAARIRARICTCCRLPVALPWQKRSRTVAHPCTSPRPCWKTVIATACRAIYRRSRVSWNER